MNPFKDTKSLSSILNNIEGLSKDSCLYISESVVHVDPSTLCLPISFEDEDSDDVEQFLIKGGLKEFLFVSDLEDVIGNLSSQKEAFTNSELIAAINYYWKNDAFLETVI